MESDFWNALSTNNHDELESILESCENVDELLSYKNKFEETTLILAIQTRFKCLTCISIILKYMPPDHLRTVTTIGGDSVLHIACRTNNLDIVKLLVEKDKELIHVRNNSQYTPLFIAVAQKNAQIVKYLIENGADVNAIDGQENSIIRKALNDNKNLGVVIELLNCKHLAKNTIQHESSYHLWVQINYSPLIDNEETRIDYFRTIYKYFYAKSEHLNIVDILYIAPITECLIGFFINEFEKNGKFQKHGKLIQKFNKNFANYEKICLLMLLLHDDLWKGNFVKENLQLDLRSYKYLRKLDTVIDEILNVNEQDVQLKRFEIFLEYLENSYFFFYNSDYLFATHLEIFFCKLLSFNKISKELLDNFDKLIKIILNAGCSASVIATTMITSIFPRIQSNEKFCIYFFNHSIISHSSPMIFDYEAGSIVDFLRNNNPNALPFKFTNKLKEGPPPTLKLFCREIIRNVIFDGVLKKWHMESKRRLELEFENAIDSLQIQKCLLMYLKLIE